MKKKEKNNESYNKKVCNASCFIGFTSTLERRLREKKRSPGRFDSVFSALDLISFGCDTPLVLEGGFGSMKLSLGGSGIN